MLVFWVITSSGLEARYQCFGGTCCFHLQTRRWRQNVRAVSVTITELISPSPHPHRTQMQVDVWFIPTLFWTLLLNWKRVSTHLESATVHFADTSIHTLHARLHESIIVAITHSQTESYIKYIYNAVMLVPQYVTHNLFERCEEWLSWSNLHPASVKKCV